jgi:general secretion pathway protein C
VSSLALPDFARSIKSSHIEQVVTACRVSLYVLMFVLLAFLGRQIVIATIEGSIASDQLAIESALVGIDNQHFRNTQKRTRDHTIILRKKFFGAAQNKQTKNEPATKKPASAPLRLRLVGTFLTPGSTPVAIVEYMSKREQDAFEVGDSIFDEAKLVTINNGSIVVDRDGVRETLTIEEFASGGSSVTASADDGPVERITVAESELDEALDNLPLLLTQARAVPYFKGGKAVGLRLFAIKTGSLFEKIGLLNGDVLSQINGNSLADFSQAMKLFEKLKQERSIKLQIERNRTARTFIYEIR